jgi:dTDP-4-dehydrorhamnose reductase
MLGTALARALEAEDVCCRQLGRGDFDLRDAAALARVITASSPETIFHCAALTRVNYCEEHPDEARLINADATAAVAAAAASVGARLIYFSTDYVFDGAGNTSIDEDTVPHPLNVYGHSKLLGELAVRSCYGGHIVRTSGVFGGRPDGQERNFVNAIWHQLDTSADEIPVVSDQWTCLTWAPHLAAMTLALLAGDMPPLVHLTSGGIDTWHGWARSVAALKPDDPERITMVSAAERGDPVARPRYSLLTSRFEHVRAMMERNTAQSGLKDYVELLNRRQGASTN